MLKQLILENWKSFRYAELPIDPLTILIGTNASGKSNVIEALEFLQRVTRGEDIETALAGDKTLASIRGGVEWAALKPESQFTIKALVQVDNENTDYLYTITVQTKPIVQLLQADIEESQEKPSGNNNFKINKQLREVWILIESIRKNLDSRIKELSKIQIEEMANSLEEVKSGRERNENLVNEINLLKNSSKEIIALYSKIHPGLSSITNIFILNPVPSQMRSYSKLADTLETDASNIAGVLAALPDEQKVEVEAKISAYVKDLPEGDIKKVWSEKVGRFGTDAMLYCQEEWKPGHVTEIDARSMSDGTLRFIAILTALLTRPEGSQLVIEEVDNGLHPSRSELLVRILREIGAKRNIDILITTHNPALLDALGPEIVPFVVVAHRDSETGESKLSLLEDINNFPKLFASASLGKLTTNGAIERSLSRSE